VGDIVTTTSRSGQRIALILALLTVVSMLVVANAPAASAGTASCPFDSKAVKVYNSYSPESGRMWGATDSRGTECSGYVGIYLWTKALAWSGGCLNFSGKRIHHGTDDDGYVSRVAYRDMSYFYLGGGSYAGCTAHEYGRSGSFPAGTGHNLHGLPTN